MTKIRLYENGIAYFIEWPNGAVDSYETEAARDARIAELRADDAAWAAA